MYARELTPRPRCTFIGEDENERIMQCGRWLNHEGDHMPKYDVQERMAEAIAAVMGYEHQGRAQTFSDYIVMRSTLDWYDWLVLE
jgi:hypothetical protein